MAKYNQGLYEIKNPEKYIGNHAPVWRSSWELVLMRMFDNNQNILQWASEPCRIPYHNPFTKKISVYVPDFLVLYQDKNNNRVAELIEVKPLKETTLENAKSNKTKMAVALNAAKWAAAEAFARSKGLQFRVMNENNIFGK